MLCSASALVLGTAELVARHRDVDRFEHSSGRVGFLPFRASATLGEQTIRNSHNAHTWASACPVRDRFLGAG
jgi:hypothetical protein